MQKAKKTRKSAAPVYAVAIMWLLLSLILPLYKLSFLILAAVLSFFAALITKACLSGVKFFRKVFKLDSEPVEEPEPEPEPERVSYGAEIDAIVADGKRANEEMGRLYASIKSTEIRAKISELMQITDKIVDDAIHDPADVPQIKRFMNYYLPTTIKLLNSYDRMSEQGIDGTNISGTMSRIEDMLDTAIDAYKKQLDALFADQALDIESDIDVMNAMLSREGFATAKDFKTGRQTGK